MRIDRDLDKTILIDIPILNDERGFLAPLTDNIDPNLIKRACFVGDYGRSVIRGLHYHKKEWKFYAVLLYCKLCFKLPFSQDVSDTSTSSEWLD